MTTFPLSYTSLQSNEVTEIAVCSPTVLVLAGKTNQTEPKKKQQQQLHLVFVITEITFILYYFKLHHHSHSQPKIKKETKEEFSCV